MLANDRDADGDLLSARLVQPPAHGTVTLDTNGAFQYTPAANYFGQDGFSYSAFDGILLSPETQVSITVRPINDAPTAVDDSFSAEEDTPLSVAAPGVLANDIDVDLDTLKVTVIAPPAHGALTLKEDGSFVYQPPQDYAGPDSFTYQVSDGQLVSAVATVTLSVVPVDDPPAAAYDNYRVAEDERLSVPAPGVLANDTDKEGDALTAVLAGEPAHGQVILAPDGSFSYEPNANYNGSDAFTYRADDGLMPSAVATVAITIDPVNDAPAAVDDSYSVRNTETLDVGAPGVLQNDSDVEASVLIAVLLDGVSHGTLGLESSGAFRYTPAAGYVGSDQFRYKASDGDKQSTPATVTIVVSSQPNRPPIAYADTYGVDEDLVLAVAAPEGLLANDVDADADPLTAVVDVLPLHGTLVLQGDGSFTYAPAADYNGADSFTYRAGDGEAQSEPAAVAIDVRPVNDPPLVAADHYSVYVGEVLAVAAPGVLANDTDVDGDTLAATLVEGPGFGELVLSLNGAFVYTAPAGITGTTTFKYTVGDGQSSSPPDGGDHRRHQSLSGIQARCDCRRSLRRSCGSAASRCRS